MKYFFKLNYDLGYFLSSDFTYSISTTMGFIHYASIDINVNELQFKKYSKIFWLNKFYAKKYSRKLLFSRTPFKNDYFTLKLSSMAMKKDNDNNINRMLNFAGNYIP